MSDTTKAVYMLSPKAAQALAMVAALAAPHGDHQGPVSGGDE